MCIYRANSLCYTALYVIYLNFKKKEKGIKEKKI